MLHKVDFPLTTAQISDFILEQGYTTYFKLQEALSQMIDSDLVQVENTHNRTLYHITENGTETIRFFRNKISPEIQQEINDFLKDRAYDLKEEVSVKANYYRNTAHEYEVHCQILENQSRLLELKLTVPTEKEAEAISANWNTRCQEIYADLLGKLL